MYFIYVSWVCMYIYIHTTFDRWYIGCSRVILNFITEIPLQPYLRYSSTKQSHLTSLEELVGKEGPIRDTSLHCRGKKEKSRGEKNNRQTNQLLTY